ncbi:MAG: metallopeptidase TldD-related protein [Paracoccus sp. (in: a-proteobacteria)]|uniref:TldD/PmbA family protein n=1 Tax=Paracoccus sp. TaxID=267 RepID=UPI0026E06AFE|nr:metallopeptidase TldD-related protein [Paracoccus sp. (in: a-proteobacteria)]MDO5620896.1 metallopeptidase TldD-related protein [Paracoccus sp. (in: a-proteobacteria)]
MLDDLAPLTARLLDAARKAGAAEADAMAVRAVAQSVDVRGRALEQAERADAVEIGLRVLLNGRQACVSASQHDDTTIAEMAARAVAMAREAPLDDNLGLADPAQIVPSGSMAEALELADDAPEPAPEALRDMALRAEAAALDHPGISQVESAGAAATRRWMWLAGTNGLSAGYGRSGYSLSTVAITGEGLAMERDWAGESRVWLSDMPAPEDIGRLAAERTLARAGARKPPTGAVPILYDERIAAGLIGHVLAAVSGTAVARGASWLRDALGQQVLPAGMDLREDPHLPRYGASRPFDAEGLPTAPRDIIRDGVVQGWTLDLATGRRLGMASTASAARSAGGVPAPVVSNVVLTPGHASRAELIRDMGRGLLVTSMLGASINPTTGDYSRGAAGFWVENGEIAYPVNECTIAGNLREMMATLIAANDARDWRSHRVPSLLVEGLTVAGA